MGLRLGRRGAFAVPFGVWYEVVSAQLPEKVANQSLANFTNSSVEWKTFAPQEGVFFSFFSMKIWVVATRGCALSPGMRTWVTSCMQPMWRQDGQCRHPWMLTLLGSNSGWLCPSVWPKISVTGPQVCSSDVVGLPARMCLGRTDQTGRHREAPGIRSSLWPKSHGWSLGHPYLRPALRWLQAAVGSTGPKYLWQLLDRFGFRYRVLSGSFRMFWFRVNDLEVPPGFPFSAWSARVGDENPSLNPFDLCNPGVHVAVRPPQDAEMWNKIWRCYGNGSYGILGMVYQSRAVEQN